eukprot:GHVU01031886.1.p1 GENE.GHVU01031886.1~~GHVU01031886.1.p1  ORF type:complete len:311 (+),score=3.03 GHVU01031886.1:281-1213(+)
MRHGGVGAMFWLPPLLQNERANDELKAVNSRWNSARTYVGIRVCTSVCMYICTPVLTCISCVFRVPLLLSACSFAGSRSCSLASISCSSHFYRPCLSPLSLSLPTLYSFIYFVYSLYIYFSFPLYLELTNVAPSGLKGRRDVMRRKEATLQSAIVHVCVHVCVRVCVQREGGCPCAPADLCSRVSLCVVPRRLPTRLSPVCVTTVAARTTTHQLCFLLHGAHGHPYMAIGLPSPCASCSSLPPSLLPLLKHRLHATETQYLAAATAACEQMRLCLVSEADEREKRDERIVPRQSWEVDRSVGRMMATTTD